MLWKCPDGPELFAYTGGTNFVRITEMDGPTAGFNPTAILSPNPASTQLTFTLPAGHYNLSIFSVTGQALRTQTIEGFTPSISIADLAPGLYFAQITDATTGASASTARFVKE